MNDRRITVRLQTRTALHVGSGTGTSAVDALVRRDAQGRAVLPGTSIAGSLRTVATRLAPRLGYRSCSALEPPPAPGSEPKACECEVCELFGNVTPAEEEIDDSREGPKRERTAHAARAARLWVLDVRLADARSWIRDGVGIERESRVAYRRGQTKFDLETLPAGLAFDVHLEIQAPRAGIAVAVEERLLAAALSEWVAGRGVLGAASGRGLGALEAVGARPVTYRRIDLSSADGLLAYLVADDAWAGATIVDTGWLERRVSEAGIWSARGLNGTVARSWVEVTAEMQFAGPFLVSGIVESAASSFDHAPFSAIGDSRQPVIPGSTLRGVLRSRAERIARTLSTGRVWQDATAQEREEEFLRRCPACDVLVSDATAALASCDALLAMSATDAQTGARKKILETIAEAGDEHLCLACRVFGSQRRGSRLRVEDATLSGECQRKPEDFVAIDRFTGGAAANRKFDAVVLWRPRFSVRLFLENPTPWELGWLLLAARDVVDGLQTIGFGAAKGFGAVESARWAARVGFLDSEDFPGSSVPAMSLVRDGLYRVVSCSSEAPSEWRQLIEEWIESFVQTVVRFKRATSETKTPPLAKDTYFGTQTSGLYPLEDHHAESR